MRNLLPKEWRLISDLNAHAFMNMAVDEAIAISCVGVGLKPTPTIRFYTWRKPAVSIGYFQRIMSVINWLKHNPPVSPFIKGGEGGIIDIVRRPTGGGIVLHGTDITYSAAIKTPTSTRNLIPLFYRQMGEAVIEGLRLLGITASLESGVKRQESTPLLSFKQFKPIEGGVGLRIQDPRLSLCTQTPVEFDVLIIPPNPPFNKGGNGGIKVAGCAARGFQETLLLQGYISIGHITDVATRQLIDAMIKGFMASLNIELVHGKLTDGEVALAEELNSKKYSRREWNYKR